MFGRRKELSLSEVLGNEDVHSLIEGYLDCRDVLSLSETENQSKFFTSPTNGEMKKNKYWKERYNQYFGEITGTHKCYEQRFRDRYEQVAQQIKENPAIFAQLRLELRNERYLALIAIKSNWRNTSYVSHHLRDDEEFVLEAISIEPYIYHDRSTRLKLNIDLAVEFAKHEPRSYKFLPEELENNPQIISIIKEALRLDKRYDVSQTFNSLSEIKEHLQGLERSYAVCEPLFPLPLPLPTSAYDGISFRKGG